MLFFAGLNNYDQKAKGAYSTSVEELSKAEFVPTAAPASSSDPKPNRSEERAEEDLKAQRQMALWAFWMMVISLAGVTVGGFGLYFLKKTLDETRALGSLTDVISKSELRAEVVAEDVKIYFTEDGYMAFNYKIFNKGKLPATVSKIRIFYRFAEEGLRFIDYEKEKPFLDDRVFISSQMVLAGDSFREINMRASSNCLPAKFHVEMTAVQKMQFYLHISHFWTDPLHQGRGMQSSFGAECNVGRDLTKAIEPFHVNDTQWDGSDRILNKNNQA